MSEYSFGDMSYSGGQPESGQQEPPAPKWFRDYMDQAKQQNEQLRAQVEQLTAEKRQTEIASAFEEKGYTRAAAALYQGEPDKVDEWLSAHGAALARVGEPQQGSRPPGEMAPPQQSQPAVPPSLQADLTKMQQMGATSAAAAPLGSDDELAAALAATSTLDEFYNVASANGWQFSRDNLGPLG